jgi:DNA modification methylase
MIENLIKKIDSKFPYEYLNGHLLIQGDCMEIMELMDDGSVGMVCTDIPYGIGFLSNRTSHHKKIANDGFDEFSVENKRWLKEFYRLLDDTGCCCCCGGGGKKPVSQLFTLNGMQEGFKLIQTLIWDKLTIGLGWRYRPSYETIVIFSKQQTEYKWYNTNKDVSNIIKMNNIIPQKEDHPTPKPINLMSSLILNHTTEEDIVLDPFAGHFTTTIACIRTDRKSICIELDESYYLQGVERVKTELKQKDFFLSHDDYKAGVHRVKEELKQGRFDFSPS